MKTKRIILFLLLCVTAMTMMSCRSQDHFGRRKAPKDCNCTKWSK